MPTGGKDGDGGDGDQQRSFLEAPAPHYTGHRQRLRERFLKGGWDAMPNYELLELVLFRALPRRDTKESLRLVRSNFIGRPALSSWKQVLEYLNAAQSREHREQFRVLFLDKKNQLIGDEVQQQGTVDHTPVYVREVVKRALELSATAIGLVHNHPSGDPTPSRVDIDMTKQIVAAAGSLGIAVHDHIIVGTTLLSAAMAMRA